MTLAPRYAVLYVQRTFGSTDYVVVSDHVTAAEAEARADAMTSELDRSSVALGAAYRVVAMPQQRIDALRYERSAVR